MLKHLHIENYALIRQTSINFADGFVAITGETGAGKSILLGALGLLLGQRADTRVLFQPDSKCIVEATFQSRDATIAKLLSDSDVDVYDDGTVLVRREILPTAKSRAFVNDTPVSVAFLKTLGSKLIDIHSQHETLLLGDSGFQTAILDSLGDGQRLLPAYQTAYGEYSALKRELERLTAEEQRQSKDLDYNQFLYEELEAAALTDGEQEQLEQELELLANAETVKETIAEVDDCLDGEEDGVVARLAAAKTRLGRIGQYHKELESLHERLDSTLIEVRDLVETLLAVDEGISCSPQRREEVEARLDLIYRLERKHGVATVSELLAIQKHIGELLGSASDNSRRIEACMEQVDKAFGEVQRAADKLTKARQKAAQALEKEIHPLLASLGMANAQLKAQVATATTYNTLGNNSITLLFNANKGGTMQELSKAASGGEMSRLMLAVKSLTARAALLPTVIFDEIDAGISGDISVKVGRIMQEMATTMQVIAITHLPQIAARANQHYKVYKSESDGATASNIKMLDSAERQHEIAVMLSAEPPTAAALQTAAELMNL